MTTVFGDQEKNKNDQRILVITVNAWSEKSAANTWKKLLDDYPVSHISNLYLREGVPENEGCGSFFCISEKKILKSIFCRGISVGSRVQPKNQLVATAYTPSGSKSFGNTLGIAREICWKLGRWKSRELDEFIDELKPTVILHSMDGYIYKNRIAEYIQKRSGARMIGYVWDDTFTYKQSSNPLYKLYRFFQRRSLKKLSKKLDVLFAISPKTKKEADGFFGIQTELLSKPMLSDVDACDYEDLSWPVNMLYTGNLNIGRDKTLEWISRALDEINSKETKIILDVYTQSVLKEKTKKKIESDFCRIHPPVSQSVVLELQSHADVLLFLEDLGKANRAARLSFSTKITDYFSAGKCIFAVGNPDLAPISYLDETGSGIVVKHKSEILGGLECLLDSAQLKMVAKNAVECGKKNHNRENMIKKFKSVIENN